MTEKNCYNKGCNASIVNPGYCWAGHPQPPDRIEFKNLSEVVKYLRDNGFSIWIKPSDGDVIRAKGPTELITRELVDAIKPFREDLLWVLRNQQGSPRMIDTERVVEKSRRNIIV